MPSPHDDNDLRKYIEAFADGELDVETNLRVLERMAMNPQATQRVMHQQELCRLVDRAMREQTPAVPAELRAKIEAMTRMTHPSAGEEGAVRAWDSHEASWSILPRLRRWAPALAASILLAVAVFLWSANGSKSVTPPPIIPPRLAFHDGRFNAPVVRTDLVESRRATAMGNRHEHCSAEVEKLMGREKFSKNVTEIPAKIADYLGPQIAVPIPDLSGLGYEFRGAGTCSLPGGKAVHLVFQPINATDNSNSMSLWIRGDDAGKIQVDEGTLYSATGEGSPHPIMVWRRGTAVYYLVGEIISPLNEVASRLYAAR